MTFLPHNIKIHHVVDQQWSLAKIEDLVRLLKKEAKTLPFQDHHDFSRVAIHKLSDISCSNPPSIHPFNHRPPLDNTYKAQRVPSNLLPEPEPDAQHPRVSVPMNNSNMTTPSYSSTLPRTPDITHFPRMGGHSARVVSVSYLDPCGTITSSPMRNCAPLAMS